MTDNFQMKNYNWPINTSKSIQHHQISGQCKPNLFCHWILSLLLAKAPKYSTSELPLHSKLVCCGNYTTVAIIAIVSNLLLIKYQSLWVGDVCGWRFPLQIFLSLIRIPICSFNHKILSKSQSLRVCLSYECHLSCLSHWKTGPLLFLYL